MIFNLDCHEPLVTGIGKPGWRHSLAKELTMESGREALRTALEEDTKVTREVTRYELPGLQSSSVEAVRAQFPAFARFMHDHRRDGRYVAQAPAIPTGPQ